MTYKKREIRPGCTRNDLAYIYKVSIDTMRKWLREIGINHGRKLFPLELELIKNKLGDPNDWN